MYANFIYFIIALLVQALYEPLDAPPYTLVQALAMALALTVLFALYARNSFNRLLETVGQVSQSTLDHRFSVLNARHSILALIVFAIDTWWLHLPSTVQSIRLFIHLPTLRTLCMLSIFVGFLLIIWYFSYDAYRAIYRTQISRRTYVYSNFAFSIPVLIPWTLLFTISDLIELLPFQWPKQILNTPAGQIGYFLIFLLIASVFAPLLIQRFWRCRPIENGNHRSRIEALCRRAGIRYAEIVYWPIFGGRMITAGVMGLVSRFRYIMVTEALLEMLSQDEIDQVVAHEIGHVKHKHLLLYLLFFIGFMVISYFVFSIGSYLMLITKPSIYLLYSVEQHALRADDLITAVLLVICIILYFRYLFGYFMRNFERQADLYVFELFPSAKPLIDTFSKIAAASGQPANKPNWHHFSIQQRINYLSKCEKAATWIRRHHKKVKKSIIIYILGFCMMTLLTYKVNQLVLDDGWQHINVADLETFLDNKTEKDSKDGLLYLMIGNIYHEKQLLKQAIAAYDKALEWSPEHADTLNNLAWLLVTIEDSTLQDPVRGLSLAQKAIQIKQAPHIWDTLAQCLFVNGRVQEAIEAEKNALSMNPEDRSLYEDQLKKFRDALNR